MLYTLKLYNTVHQLHVKKKKTNKKKTRQRSINRYHTGKKIQFGARVSLNFHKYPTSVRKECVSLFMEHKVNID